METNRNYSNRSAMAISQCYEAMAQFSPALRYALLAKTKYHYYSWCGTCYDSANFVMNKRIAYLALRAEAGPTQIKWAILSVIIACFRRLTI